MALTKVSYSMIAGAGANVLDYGADPTGTNDSSAAIQAAITANGHVHIPAGNYRCDNSILIESTYTNRKYVTMTGATKLTRLSAFSASTGPVIELLGNYGHFDGGFGEIASENTSPRGVVALGQRDNNTLSTGNGLFWSFQNCDVRCKDYVSPAVPAPEDAIGVYIPSAQPFKGSDYANYFGTVSNVRVYSASTAYWLTDQVNAHTFVNCTVEFFWHYAWRFNGSYGNTVYGGFINGAYRNGAYGLFLGNKLYPAAPFPASHQSNNNNIYGMTMEFYTSGNFGVYIPAGVAGQDSAHNYVQISWNSSGTPVTDLTGGINNTIYDGLTTFRIGENLQMPDQAIAGRNLLQVGTTAYSNAHAIAKTVPPGATAVILENLNPAAALAEGLQVVWNTPTIGYSGSIISAYHKPTAQTVFKVLDNGNCQNLNGVYGTVSDAKLKNIIGLSGSQWADVKFLASKITRYTLKADVVPPDPNCPCDTPEPEVQLGWIAQEIEGQCPSLVYETPDYNVAMGSQTPTGTTTKGVKYSVAQIKAFKALGEAMARIEVLEQQVAALIAAQ